jgi:predicted nucleic acid-binding protein
VILYLDASALVKRYVREAGSDHVAEMVSVAASIGTVVITEAEVGAALARAARQGFLSDSEARLALDTFRFEWPDLVRVPVGEALVRRAVDLSWEHELRAYDSVQLAAGLEWRDVVREPVQFATFDVALWKASRAAGLTPFPPDLARPSED